MPKRLTLVNTPSAGIGSPNSLRSPRLAFRAARLTASAMRTGLWYSGSEIRSPGRPPGSERSMMFGGVRTASHTFAAPPVARSCAISIPDEPEPTTSTRLSAYGDGLRYADECSISIVEPTAPGNSGMHGVCSFPLATTTWRASMSPAEVCSRHPGALRSMRWTSVPSSSSIPSSCACRSRWAMTSSRCGNIGVPFGYGRFGRCENGRPVLSFSRSYRPRQEAATASARSMTSGRSPRSHRLTAIATPAGPAPMIAMSSLLISPPTTDRAGLFQRARGCAPAQTSLSACTVTRV